MAPRMVWLKAHPNQGDRTGIWERHPDHPKLNEGDEFGEIFVAGQDSEPVKAAETPAVLDALKEDRVIRLEGAELEKARELAETAEERKVAARAAARLAADPDADPRKQRTADARAEKLEVEIAELRGQLTELRARAEAKEARDEARAASARTSRTPAAEGAERPARRSRTAAADETEPTTTVTDGGGQGGAGDGD